MAPLVLNRSRQFHDASSLLAPPVLSFADVIVAVASATYPAHRVVLALHSPLLRTQILAPDAAPPMERLHLRLTVPSLSNEQLRAGWQIVYDYLYELQVSLVSANSALAALEICDEWKFEHLADILLRFVLSEVTPGNCVQISLVVKAGGERSHSSRLLLVRDKCAQVMKLNFDQVTGWGMLDIRTFARLLKLNDLNVQHNEQAVFWAVVSWVDAQGSLTRDEYHDIERVVDTRSRKEALFAVPQSSEPPKTSSSAISRRANEFDGDENAEAVSRSLHSVPFLTVSEQDVESLIKLVRFPTISRHDVALIINSEFVSRYPIVQKYAAQAGRAPRRHITIETSPLFRPRRVYALTFADRISSFSRINARLQTSARYFAGCLWHLIVGKKEGYLELYLGALSEEAAGAVDVRLDFSLYVAEMSAGSRTFDPPPMVRRETKRAHYTRSGQRIGFVRLLKLESIAEFARNDMLCIGASLRLEGCDEQVEAIDDFVDHSSEAVTD